MVIAIVYNNWIANELHILSGPPEDMVDIFRKRFYESLQLEIVNNTLKSNKRI